MNTFIHLSILIGTFFLMEGVAWATHKYIMHGFLWNWHKSHHTPHDQFLEKNDLFAVVFSLPAILLIVIGFEIPSLALLKWVGFGITAYGVFYIIFHDIIVHRRIKIRFMARSRYMKRMIRAHKIHHKYLAKHGAEAFGFLYAPKKYDPHHQK